MPQTLKIAVPMAGLGTRMRPHTYSKPKPLIALAGKTVLDYVLEQFDDLPGEFDVEYVFIVGPTQVEQVKEHMCEHHPEIKVQFVIQEKMRGQSDALYLAREYLHGPMLMAFSDTLVEADLSAITRPDLDGMAWVRPVPDPRRFGVAQVNKKGYITRLIEKPQDMSNNLVVVGFYFFREAEKLMDAIAEQMDRKVMLKDEFFLADAVNILLERGAKMRTQEVSVWMDAGMPDALLETNRYLLENGRDNSAQAIENLPGVAIIPPVFISPKAKVTASVIGPYVSIGEDCCLNQVVVVNSILEEGAQVEHMVLSGSHLGRDVNVHGQITHLNLGDRVMGDELSRKHTTAPMDSQDQVECYAGHEYPQRPVAFWWQGQRLVVVVVRSEARLPHGKRFVVETTGEQVFEINYNQARDTWTVRDAS